MRLIRLWGVGRSAVSVCAVSTRCRCVMRRRTGDDVGAAPPFELVDYRAWCAGRGLRLYGDPGNPETSGPQSPSGRRGSGCGVSGPMPMVSMSAILVGPIRDVWFGGHITACTARNRGLRDNNGSSARSGRSTYHEEFPQKNEKVLRQLRPAALPTRASASVSARL